MPKDSGTPPTADPTQYPLPYPPPYQSLKRWTAFLLVLSVVLTGLWLAWSAYAQSRLQSSIDAVKAAGEPLFPADFVRPKIPDDQNAVYYLMAAANEFTPIQPAAHRPLGQHPSFISIFELVKAAQQEIQSNSKALLLLHQAARCQKADWGIDMKSPVILNLRGDKLNIAFALLAIQLNLSADFPVVGDMSRRGEMACDSLSFSSVPNAFGFGEGQEQASEMQELVLENIGQLNRPTAGEVRASGADVPPIYLSQLIPVLLDEKQFARNRQWAALTDRMKYFDSLQWASRHATLLRPFYQLECAYRLEYWTNLLRAAEQPNYPAALSVLSAQPKSPIWDYSQSVWPIPKESLQRAWQLEAERRVLAVALAIRLYHHDHGSYPSTLAALVPAYLDRIPTNPLIPGDVPVGYLDAASISPINQYRPMLYVDVITPSAITPPPIRTVPFFFGAAKTRIWYDLLAQPNLANTTDHQR